MDVSGKIELGGVTSEFTLIHGSYEQWGASRQDLGRRVELLEALGDAYASWAAENLCSECQDALLDDGEGWNGLCGDCADKADPQDDEEG